jgi:hypothetical protein
MAVAHSAASESHAATTGSTNQTAFSWTHTQTGTPQGVLVFVHVANSTGNPVSSVTYGSVTLTRVSGGAAIDSAGEAGRTDLFFAGSGLASGNQTITVNRANTADIMYASAATVTAATDTNVTGIVLLQGDGTLTVQSVTDGGAPTNSLRYAGAYSGLASPPPAGTGSTLLNSIDFGNYGIALVRETTAGTGARNVGFNNATTDDRAAVHVAVRELWNQSETPFVGDFRLTERNAYRWSDDYTQSTWTKTLITVTPNNTTAPDGTTTASLLLETASGGNHTLQANTTNKRGKVYTISGYFKNYAGTNTRRVQLQLGNSLEWGLQISIRADLVAGTITQTSGAPLASGIIDVGSGWYRLYVTAVYTQADSSVNGLLSNVYLISGTSTINYTGDANSGVYVWGMQYEEGELSDYDPSYSIPTNGRLATDLLVKSGIAGETGSFALAGPAATLTEFQPDTLSAETAAFALTGQPASTRHNVRIEAGTGGLTLAGQPATLTKATAKAIAAETGTFTLTGNPATLADTDRISAEVGTFALASNGATLRQSYAITAEAGSFAAAGQPATLRHNPRIEANTGSFAVAGGAPAILRGRYLSGGSGTFTETGQPATLRRTWGIQGGTGAFALTGSPASLTELGAYEIDAVVGAFVLSGQPAALRQSRALTTEPGSFATTGQPAVLRQAYQLSCAAGAFIAIGQPATLAEQNVFVIEAGTGSFALSGNNAYLTQDQILPVDTGLFAATGQPVTLIKASTARRRNVLIF